MQLISKLCLIFECEFMEEKLTVKIELPQIFGNPYNVSLYYKDMIDFFEALGYVYKVDYKFEWLAEASISPKYIILSDELALIFKLKYRK